MRRPLMYLLAWAFGACAIVTVSWLGITSALGAAAPTRVAPLSPVDLRDVVPSSAPPSPSQSPSADPSGPAGDPGPSEAASASAPAEPSTSPPAESWVAQSDGRGGTGYKRTVHTAGGDAVVWSSRGDARILEAIPKSGWESSIRHDEQDTATVIFVMTGQRARTAYVSVAWLGGPVAEFGETIGLSS